MAGGLVPGTVGQRSVADGDPRKEPRGVTEGELTLRLGEAGYYGPDNGRVGALNLLAYAGLPVPEGVVLTRRAHEEFLLTSGILREIRGASRRRAAEIRPGYGSSPVEGELNRTICEALIGLSAKAVVVISDDLEKGGLRSIPEVRDAVRDAWLSVRGLERQIEAAARGEDLPTWPVLVQKELHPQYTGWSITGEAAVGAAGRRSGEAPTVALYDVEPTGGAEGKGIAGFTLKAGHVLGEPVRIRWGLEDGRWYVLSASSCQR
jgi:hypothetical protein